MSSLTLCKPVHNVKFGSHGKNVLNQIRKDLETAKIGSALLMSATLHSLFTKTSSAAEIGINVSMTDWEALSKATRDWPIAVKAIIARRAYEMVIYTNGEEQAFWEELHKCLSE